MKKTITVTLDDRTIEVSKLPLGRYAEMLKMLKELPKHLAGMSELSNDKVLENLPELLTVALPEIIDIIALATPLKSEEIEQLGIDELTDVVLAIMDANKYQNVYSKIKKALARTSQEHSGQEVMTTGSGGQ